MGAELRIDMRKPLRRGSIFRGGRIELGQLTGKGFDLLLHAAEFGKDRQALLEDAAAREYQPLLRKIAGGHAARALQTAVVERVRSPPRP